MRWNQWFGLLFTIVPLGVGAQVINDGLSYRSISSDHYTRLYYENDYFSATDYYYTQGMYFEFVDPALRKNPVTLILVHPHATEVRYGLSAHHEAYTPTSYESNSILYGDRPFAADVFLKSFTIATDSIRNDRVTTSLSTGLIGPGAGGFEIQDFIHRNTPNARPHGWQYQVQNDVVLNYEMDYEKALISIPNHFLVNGYAAARLGTLSTRAAVGFTLMGGFFNDPFRIASGRKWGLYMYDHPQVEAVGYDATLQGGLFNRQNPYIISAKNISRITFENRYGGVFTYKWLYLEYFQRYITKEFSTGTDHHCGGIQMGISL